MGTAQKSILVVTDNQRTIALVRDLKKNENVEGAGFHDGLAKHSLFSRIVIEHSSTFDAFHFMRLLRQAGVTVHCTVLVRYEPETGLQGFLPPDFAQMQHERYIIAPSLFATSVQAQI